jgi:hypothetical protein
LAAGPREVAHQPTVHLLPGPATSYFSCFLSPHKIIVSGAGHIGGRALIGFIYAVFHSRVKAGQGWIEVVRAAFSFVYWCDFGLTFWAIRNGVWLDSADLFFIPYAGVK